MFCCELFCLMLWTYSKFVHDSADPFLEVKKKRDKRKEVCGMWFLVIDNVCKCNRILATRILLNHNGDPVAGVVGWISLLVIHHMVSTSHPSIVYRWSSFWSSHENKVSFFFFYVDLNTWWWNWNIFYDGLYQILTHY